MCSTRRQVRARPPAGRRVALGFLWACWCAAPADAATGDREALVALYEAARGADWKANAGWLDANVNFCLWSHVTCALGDLDKLDF